MVKLRDFPGRDDPKKVIKIDKKNVKTTIIEKNETRISKKTQKTCGANKFAAFLSSDSEDEESNKSADEMEKTNGDSASEESLEKEDEDMEDVSGDEDVSTGDENADSAEEDADSAGKREEEDSDDEQEDSEEDSKSKKSKHCEKGERRVMPGGVVFECLEEGEGAEAATAGDVLEVDYKMFLVDKITAKTTQEIDSNAKDLPNARANHILDLIKSNKIQIESVIKDDMKGKGKGGSSSSSSSSGSQAKSANSGKGGKKGLGKKGNKDPNLVKALDKGDVDWLVGDRAAMVPGFDFGCRHMRKNEVRRLYVPAKQGYGKRGHGTKIPKNADLLFEVKVKSVGLKWNKKNSTDADDRGKRKYTAKEREIRRRRARKNK